MSRNNLNTLQIKNNEGSETTGPLTDNIKDIKDLIEPKEKVFASLLHQQEDEVNKTEDATVVEESLAEFLETEKPRKEVCDLIFNLLKRTQEKTIE